MWILLDSDDWINLDYCASIVRRKDGTGAAEMVHVGTNGNKEWSELTPRDMQRIHERLLNADQR